MVGFNSVQRRGKWLDFSIKNNLFSTREFLILFFTDPRVSNICHSLAMTYPRTGLSFLFVIEQMTSDLLRDAIVNKTISQNRKVDKVDKYNNKNIILKI